MTAKQRTKKASRVATASLLCTYDLPCYCPGEDKGIFAQGRGYTSYHKTPRLVCMTRHLHGCPVVAACRACRRALAPCDQQDRCRCGSTEIDRLEGCND